MTWLGDNHAAVPGDEIMNRVQIAGAQTGD
jgi:hypothetical protein